MLNNNLIICTDIWKCSEVYPAFEKQGSPIVFESSGWFVPYLSIAIQSIINHSSVDNYYDILILGDGISCIDRCRITQQIAGLENFSIRFLEPKIEVIKYIKKAKYNYITVNYYRMALPWLLRNYKTAVNLGADIMLFDDISHLLKTTLSEKQYIAGAMDLGYIGRLSEDIPQSELELKYPNEYINADVIIYNLESIRKNYSIDEIMNYWQKFHFRCNEQDALNKLFDGHKKLLELRWNVFPERMTSTKDILCTSKENVLEWKNAQKNPGIVHFAAVPKPWDFPIVCFGPEWWQIARSSIYYEEILRRSCTKIEKQKSSVLDFVETIFIKDSKRYNTIKKCIEKKNKWGMNTKLRF